jgi:segregation and condensation protein B
MSDHPEPRAAHSATDEAGPDLQPEVLAPADRLPEDQAPKDVAQEDPVPEDQAPVDVAPEDPVPEDQAPEGVAPENRAPEALAPERVVPEQRVAEATQRTSLREPDEDSLRLAEALVFASAEPVTPRGLARVLADDIDADAVLAALRTRYAGRGVELVDAGNGVMFRTAVDLASRLRKVIESPRRLPRVAMETLAIVAYHQPVTRPEIEHIRGTALSQQTLDALLELNLIAPKGRRETPGRPTLWGTTPEFLAHFGLKDIRELPRREDLLLETGPPKATPEVLPPDLQPPPE